MILQLYTIQPVVSSHAHQLQHTTMSPVTISAERKLGTSRILPLRCEIVRAHLVIAVRLPLRHERPSSPKTRWGNQNQFVIEAAENGLPDFDLTMVLMALLTASRCRFQLLTHVDDATQPTSS